MKIYILPVESFCNKYDEDIGNYIISYILYIGTFQIKILNNHVGNFMDYYC